ncbi:DUF1801 domain-containing protein [Sediminibacterium ginsengisoli]|uniref:YdhG-like domain-containing protein n=1 Tax=Sediminibacterium ginsengisoli TaxID=413434 RepID=A0A1T4QGX0_9BACT|nr:DUF1801 domain-containing protein [Sediminibacterium ginsengisoli]SKA02944.1 protein of unknown function (DU1801) [Sediminibacterium ginsengisoli]
MKSEDLFYETQLPVVKECLLALRSMILAQDKEITTAWKYGMPFFCYKGKMFCYLWFHKKYKLPYIGFVEGKHLDHPQLIQEKRARMKIFLCDPEKELAVEDIRMLVKDALAVYKKKRIMEKE